MADSSSTASFKVLNQDFIKLDRFDGTNFNRWKDKMMFLLTALNVTYVLYPKLKAISEASQDATSKEKAKVAKFKKNCQEDEYVCRGYILNTLSDRLYGISMPISYPNEIWKALETKHNTERQGTVKFLELKMLDSILVVHQVREL